MTLVTYIESRLRRDPDTEPCLPRDRGAELRLRRDPGEAEEEEGEHDTRDSHVQPVALAGEGEEREGHPRHRRGNEHEQPELDQPPRTKRRRRAEDAADEA